MIEIGKTLFVDIPFRIDLDIAISQSQKIRNKFKNDRKKKLENEKVEEKITEEKRRGSGSIQER